MRRKFLTLCSALSLLACVAYGIYRLVVNPLDPFDNRKFSPSAWQQVRVADRHEMVRDLLSHHLRTGMSAQQVTALLGRPDEILDADAWDTVADVGERTYAYSVKHSEPLSVSWDYIEDNVYVNLDGAGRVTAVRFDPAKVSGGRGVFVGVILLGLLCVFAAFVWRAGVWLIAPVMPATDAAREPRGFPVVPTEGTEPPHNPPMQRTGGNGYL